MADETIAALRSIPMFSDVDDAGLKRIAEVGTDFRAPAGQVLVEHGQPGSGLFVIEEGRVVVDLPHGGVLERGPGEFFGELAVLIDTPRTARVSAASEVRCLAIRRDDFQRLLHDEPSIAVAMLMTVASRLAAVT